MSSADSAPPGADLGLLSPVRVASAAEAATGDAAFLQAMLDAEAALTQAQAALGLAPSAAVDAIRAAARVEAYHLPRIAARARAGGNPVIPLVADLTAAVAARDPDAAGYVHRGATSQDILDTAMMLVARRVLGLVLDDLDRTVAALARLAAEHRETPMPGRTLTQHAVPTTFGLKVAGWRSLVLDAHDRLHAVRRSLPVQLGGAAGTLAAFHPSADADASSSANADADASAGTDAPVDADGDIGLLLLAQYAEETGLAEPGLPWHTLRTPVADLGAALAFTAGALGKLAADVLVLSRTEIAEVSEGIPGGSSAMPHKRNPVRATLLAAAARQVPALATVILGAVAAEDERPAGAWHAEWQTLREALRLVGGAARDAADLAESLRVRPHRMRAHLDLTDGAIGSERLGAALAPVFGWAEAKELVARACRHAATRGVSLDVALREEPGLAGRLAEERLAQLIDPARYLGSAAALTDRALRRRPRTEPPATKGNS